MAHQKGWRGMGGVGRGAMRLRGRSASPISTPLSRPSDLETGGGHAVPALSAAGMPRPVSSGLKPPGMAVRAATPAGPKPSMPAKPVRSGGASAAADLRRASGAATVATGLRTAMSRAGGSPMPTMPPRAVLPSALPSRAAVPKSSPKLYGGGGSR